MYIAFLVLLWGREWVEEIVMSALESSSSMFLIIISVYFVASLVIVHSQ